MVASLPDEEWHDWMPPVSRPEALQRTPRLHPASLPAALKSCYLWTLRIADHRTVRMANKEGEVTGQWLRAHPLPGLKLRGIIPAHPRLAPDDEQLEDAMAEHSEDEDCATASVLHINSTEWHGWRTTYRTSSPEDVNAVEPQVARRLTFKLRNLKGALKLIPKGPRRQVPTSKPPKTPAQHLNTTTRKHLQAVLKLKRKPKAA